jgi:hypothetical protein
MMFFDHFRLWFMGSMRENSFSGKSLPCYEGISSIAKSKILVRAFDRFLLRNF